MIQEERITQAPIRTANGAHTPIFLTNRATIWEKLSGLTKGSMIAGHTSALRNAPEMVTFVTLA